MKVLILGNTKNDNKKIQDVKEIKVLAYKGIIDDRHFQIHNDPYYRLSLM